MERERERGEKREKEREEEERIEERKEEREEEREEEEKLIGRLKWGYTRINELKQLYTEVLKEGVKGLSAKIETSNLMLTAEIHLPENSGTISFDVAYTENGLKLVGYTIDLKDLLIVYSSAGSTLMVKDQYETWVGTNIEEPSSVSLSDRQFITHLLTTLALHALSNTDMPMHIANEHLWRLAELERKLFPLSS